MMRNKPSFSPLRLTIFILLSAAAMGLIFAFSAQNGELSSSYSGFAANILRRVLSPVLPGSAVEFIIRYIRKAAHIFIYFVLGIFLSLSAGEISLRTRRLPLCLLAAWLICILYAAGDEFHQSFVPGRSASPIDVLIDSAGSLASVLITGGICHLKRKTKPQPAR